MTLALAGHSHGGQLRLPMLGAVVHRRGMGPYARGLYRTSNGPLHVSSGLGTWRLPLRFPLPTRNNPDRSLETIATTGFHQVRA